MKSVWNGKIDFCVNDQKLFFTHFIMPLSRDIKRIFINHISECIINNKSTIRIFNLLNEDIKLKTFTIHKYPLLHAKQFASWKTMSVYAFKLLCNSVGISGYRLRLWRVNVS
ncbi:CLUMA_CG009167, isoform A [Clunio marinus]|uniref:CLUMA_CG009167, isoform A n=1 Tax=Clunio marinus TaxID=568069 RepID=A0A1J1I9R9_9DIPT|nr:CLUMA_CG009167, isoform A [Clunio marinus]